MLRLRRYRVFLAFAIIAVLAFVHFSGLHNWSTPPIAVPEKEKDPSQPQPAEPPSPNVHDVEEPHGFLPETESPIPLRAIPTPIDPSDEEVTSTAVSSATQSPVSSGDDDATPVEKERPDYVDSEPMVHWSKQPENFPVPSSEVIPLPTGRPKKIPKVQFDFPKESPKAKKEREEKLALIKASFEHSWSGYKQEAWGHDEVRPVTGGSKDSFNGWGATLVDSLDTMWMMGLTEEFEEALEAVEKIDFTTSEKNEIPLFETVIRYLGGLIGAYDISGGKYQVLLDKACELAEVLMGAFDTPNRMPDTYYKWMP